MSAGAPPRPSPRTGIVVLLAALTLPACASGQVGVAPSTGAGPAADLSALLDSLASTPPLDGAHWGVLFRDLETGRTLASSSVERRFIPASNVKLAVTVAALEILGPGHRWHTAIWADAPVEDGTLLGDLVLPATGDPSLSERFHGDDRAPLDSLARQVRARGIRTVAGDLVVDVSRWDSIPLPGSWMVEDLGGWWGATPGAFAVAEGEIRIEATPGPIGEPARLRSWPAHEADPFLDVEITTVHPDSSDRVETWYLPGSGRLIVRGTVEAGPPDTFRISAREPVEVAARALADALAEAGVELLGEVRIVRDPEASTTDPCFFRGEPGSDDAMQWCELIRCPDGEGPDAGCRRTVRRVAELVSPPLSEIARAVLEPSQNWIAEQLVVALGIQLLPDPAVGRSGYLQPRILYPALDPDEDPPPRREAVLAVLEETLVREAGVDSLDVRLMDASGLSTQNLLTPRAVVRMLEHAWAAPWRDAFVDALAAPGEEESTLEDRLEELEGSLQAKTGTLTNVVALSGYLRTAEGRRIVFSVLLNGTGVRSSTSQGAVDALVRAVAAGAR